MASRWSRNSSKVAKLPNIRFRHRGCGGFMWVVLGRSEVSEGVPRWTVRPPGTLTRFRVPNNVRDALKSSRIDFGEIKNLGFREFW